MKITELLNVPASAPVPSAHTPRMTSSASAYQQHDDADMQDASLTGDEEQGRLAPRHFKTQKKMDMASLDLFTQQ